MGQEAGRRRSSLQVEETSLVDGLAHIKEGGLHDVKNTNLIFGAGKWP